MGYVGISKISEILHVKEKTIYQWAETGQIPSYKFNGVLRFKEDEIIKWAESCKTHNSNSIIRPLRSTAPGKEKVTKNGAL